GVVEARLRAVGSPGYPVDERNMRPRRLEVEEVLSLDLGELFGAPGLREVAGRERGALSAVVPAAERTHEHRASQLRTLQDPQLVGHFGAVYVRRETKAGGRQKSVTSATVPAQTVAARPTWTSTSPHG